MSSKDWPDTLSLSEGIFENTARNPLRSWNNVYLKYCSSDAHMGDAEQFGFSFRGQRIVEAMLADLVKRGLGDVAAQTLLFSGCSAGGRGAMATADFVPGILAAAGAANPVNVLALFDAALYVSEPPAVQGKTPMIQQAKGVFQLFNVKGRVPQNCRERYADTPWYCIFGQYRLPLVATKHILTHQQYDMFAMLTQRSYGFPPFTTSQLEWFEGYRNSILASINVTPPEGSIYFSTACYEHCFTESNAMWTYRVEGFSLGDYLAKFLRDERVTRRALVDNCEGFDCTCAQADNKHRAIALLQSACNAPAHYLCDGLMPFKK
jgi:hypothetical protein